MSENGRGVVIGAPVARAAFPSAPHLVPSKDEIIQLQAAQIRELEATLDSRTVLANTIANSCLCLLDRLVELGYASRDLGVAVDKDRWEKQIGLQLTVTGDEKTGKVTVRAREQEKPAPVAVEDRSES